MSCTSNLGIRTRSVQCVGGQICNKLVRPHNTETCISNAVACVPQVADDLFADVEITLNKSLPSLSALDELKSSSTQGATESSQDDFFADLFVKIVKQLNRSSKSTTSMKSASSEAAFRAPKFSAESKLDDSAVATNDHNSSLTTTKRKTAPKRRDIVIDLNDESISSMITNNENGTISESYLINLLKVRMKGQGLTTTGLTTTPTSATRLITFDIDTLINRMNDEKLEYEWETGVFGSVNV